MTTPRAILILGAGRSGTSTLARGIAALGVNLGRHFAHPVRKNPRGQFEEIHLLRLSKAVRRTLGLRAGSVRLLTASDWQTPALEPLRRRMREAITREFGTDAIWGFKYGSTSRILPFWLDLLPEMGIEPAFAFAYRNPLSVARSRARLDRARGRTAKNNIEWLVNVVPYFHHLRDHRSVVVDYDRLIVDPDHELRRVAERLDLPLTAAIEAEVERFSREFVEQDWQHTQFTEDDLLADPDTHPLLRRAAGLLAQLARDEISLDDPTLWDAWHDILSELQVLAPTLGLIDQLQADVRRASWWDLRIPLRIAWRKLPLLRAR